MKNQVGECIGDRVLYRPFRCEGCRCEGELGVPEKAMGGTIACPEGCGAVYVQHRSVTGQPTLTCVVCPVAADDLEYDETDDDEGYTEGLDDEWLDDGDDYDDDFAEDRDP